MKKIIIGLLVTLILLLITVTIFNPATQRNVKNFNKSKVAPTPTFIRRVTTTPISKETQQKIRILLSKPMSTFTTEQKTSLQSLTSKLPYSSADFDMVYSQKLNHYFITRKTLLAYDRLKEFLAQNNALDLYLNGYGIITVTTDPLDKAISKYETAMSEAVEDPEHDTGHPSDESNVKGASDENDLNKSLIDVFKGIINSPALSEGEAEPTTPGGFKEPTIPGELSYPPGVETATPDENGYVELPESPNGEYKIYSCVNKRKGQKALLGVLYTTSLAWKSTYPPALLSIGDLNASGHSSHKTGIDVDVIVTDNSATNVNDAENYDKNRAVALGEMFMNTKLIYLIFFNDENVRQAVNAYAAKNNLPGEMQYWEGHEDHFHVRINVEGGTEVSPGC